MMRFEGPLPEPFAGSSVEQYWKGGEGYSCKLVGADGEAGLLKVLDPDEESVEASLLLSLRHPRIPRLLEQGFLATGAPYLLREWVEGEPLGGDFPWSEAKVLELAVQLLEILGYVHLRGLLHLDLKPANLLCDAEGRYHLLDFGLGGRKGTRSRSGTPFFAAPEQWAGGALDRRTDLYSLGLLLVVALQPGILRSRAGGNPSGWDLEDLSRDLSAQSVVSDAMTGLLEGLVARQPHRRFYDAEEALAWLGQGSGRPSLSLLEPDPVLYPPDKAMSAPQLAAHLTQSLGLPDGPAKALGDRILSDGCERPGQVASWLLDRVTEGSILPRGAGWSFPDALSGRVQDRGGGPAIVDAAGLRDSASRGRIHAAERAFRALLDAGADEVQTRAALADGLLLAGEPARALPLLHDRPLQRLRALLDLGRIREAREGLASLPAEALAGPGGRRLQASLAWLSGQAGEALELAEQARVHEGGAEADIVLAHILAETGKVGRARELLEGAIADLRSGMHPFLLAGALSNLGDILRKAGDWGHALACHEEALTLYQGLGHARYTALAQSNLGVAQKDGGRWEEALESQRRARGLYEHVGDARGAAIALANQGILSLELEQPEVALGKLQEARAALRQLGVGNLDMRLHLEIARAAMGSGDLDGAWEMLEGLEVDPGLSGLYERLRTQCEAGRQRLALGSRVGDDRSGGAPRMASQDEGIPTGEGTGVPRAVFRSFVAINRKLANETDLDRALHALLDTALTLSGARQGYLLLSGPDGIRTELRIGQGPGGKAYSRSIANRAMQEQRILEGSEALADRDLLAMPSVRRLEQRSALCVPFQCVSGQTGALYVEHPGRAGVFGEAEKEHLEVLADQAAIAVDRMLREEDLSAELLRSRRDLAAARQALGARRPRRELLGRSAGMEAVRSEIQRLAPSSLPVLIRGETGTGKELVAEAVHRESRRSQGPFTSQNCAAIPTELAESLLFGHVKGAFTGADEDRPGLLELASGGTLFLDEIGELPLLLQAKLLRALQEGAIRRVGGDREHELDLRLIAATHRDLEKAKDEGTFREDLYYRIAAAVLVLPPLRERGEDAEFLAEHFLDRLIRQEGQVVELSEHARTEIREYSWPGNVRELEHRMARAFLMNEEGIIRSLGLPKALGTTSAPSTFAWPVTSLKEVEKKTIEAVLEHTEGDKTRAARILEISRTALYEKLKRMKAETGD